MIKIAYVTNFLNHHTKALAQELYCQTKGNFVFIETQATMQSSDRNFKQGYAYYWASQFQFSPPWLLQAYCEEQSEKCRQILLDYDVVIIANAGDEWILPRLKQKKMTFRAHERWYKNTLTTVRWPRAVLGGWLHHRRFSSLHMLCASAYTAWDTHRVFCYEGKRYCWGYFPEAEKLSYEALLEKKQGNTPKILWAGRMVSGKHARDALAACQRLWRKGYSFTLQFVGSGEQEEMLHQSSKEFCENVIFSGAATPDKTRAYMEQSNIFIMTSDFCEGWGVVVNEAMSCGCAVVASHAAGAVPYLLRHRHNGLIYPSGDIDALTKAIQCLLDSPALVEEYGLKAYETISEVWSPKNAAERLIKLCNWLLDGHTGSPFTTGPCSKAPVIRNNDYCTDLRI